jgi:hypothetical protein
MARLKSSYRPKAYADGGAVSLDTPETVYEDIEAASKAGDPEALEDAYKRLPSAEVNAAELEVDQDYRQHKMAANPATAEAQDDASRAFQVQIDNLRKAEQVQYERNKLAAFLKANPAMVRHPEITGQAEIEAQREHAYGSPAFYEAVKSNFDRLTSPEEVSAEYLEKMQALGEDVSEPELEVYEPPAPSIPRHDSMMYSAPVSREVPGSSYNDRSGRVTLTPAMKEAAAIAGVSLSEYAEQVLRLREEKKSGNYGGAP